MVKSKKEVTFQVGDEVYFNNYSREVEEKLLRPNTQAKILDIFETTEGDTAYVIESRKGVQETVFSDEMKLKEKTRVSKDAARDAVQKDVLISPVETVDPREEAQKARLLESGDKDERFDMIITNELQEMLDGSPTDPLQVAKALLLSANKSYFRLGGALTYIYLEGLYQNYYDSEGNPYVGRDAFNRFIDNEIPNMKSRRARYYMEIYVKFTNWGIAEDEVASLGWTLAQQIAAVANRDTVRELIDYAKAHNGTELEVYINKNFKSKERIVEEDIVLQQAQVGKMKHMSFSVFEDQFSVIEAAFEHVKEQHPDLDPEKVSQAFVVMASDYLSNVQAEQGTVTVESFVQYGETVFPDKEVFIRDKKTGEIYNPRYEYGQVNIHTTDSNVQENQQEVEALAG